VKFTSIYGVDFSGAREAGRNICIAHARLRPAGRRARGREGSVPRLELIDLDPLEKLCGVCDREPALLHLVDAIAASDRALWGIDAPFGLPVEIFDDGVSWRDQLEHLRAWPDGAYSLGLWCLDRARKLGGPLHIRRATDSDAKAPFDGYHYRIIYQTFHGMRDVAAPLARRRSTAILPFHYPRLRAARRVVVETCPGSTLKRWGVPHQNYKQPTGGPLVPKRLRTRTAILAALAGHIEISDAHRRVIMRNPGGDALDAVIAAVGSHQSFTAADHRAIARHVRYPREGYLYA
jgi:hypothetical protein